MQYLDIKEVLEEGRFPSWTPRAPTLVLSQEAESSNERSIFAANFTKHLKEKPQKSSGQKSQNWRQNDQQENEGNSQREKWQKSQKQRFQSQKPQGRGPEPIEVDSSSLHITPSRACALEASQ